MNIRLFLVLFLAFLLRVYHLDYKPLHFDEKASLACALGIPFAGINQVGSAKWESLNINAENFTPKDFEKYNNVSAMYRAALQDNGSIFYFFTLHNWIKIVGVSYFSIRFLSLIFSFFTVFLVYFFARQLSDSENIALLSALLLAIHPLSIASAQFCRSHAMAGFFSLSASIFFLNIIHSQKISIRQLILYGTSCGAAMLCHYFAMYVFLGHGLVMLFLIRDRIKWLAFVLGGVLGIILFAVWLLLGGLEGLQIVSKVHDQFSAITKNWSVGDNPYYIPATFKNVMGGVVQVLLPLFGNYLQNLGFRLSQILILLAIPVGLVGYALYQARKSNSQYHWIILLTILVTAQPLWGIAISLRMGYMIFLQPIYAQYVTPYCAVLLAMAFTHTVVNQKNNLAFILLWLVYSIIFIFSIYSIYFNGGITKKDEQIAAEIRQYYTKESTIVYSNWEQAFFTSIHLKNQNFKQKIIKNQANKNIFLVGKDSRLKTEINVSF